MVIKASNKSNFLRLFIAMSLAVFIFVLSPKSKAGFFEVGASFSYLKHSVDEANFEETKDVSASVSYYFWLQSAIELSYTSGLKTINLGTAGVPATYQNIQSEYQMKGADLVISFADPKADFRPYIKVGAVHIHKKIVEQTGDFPATTHPFEDGVAPSAGIGLKLKFTEALSLKLGAEAWTTPLTQDKTTYDYAGRAGLSWLF